MNEKKKPRTPFLENLFITNHKRGHKFLSIAKVGSTTLKTLTAQDDGYLDGRINGLQEIHQKIFGLRHNGASMVRIGSNLYPNYTRVAVYRDPVERVTSWYKDKILGYGNDKGYVNYTLKLDLIGETDLSRIIQFLRFELGKPHDEWVDQHLRPFTRYISDTNIDIVVHIEHLDQYLESIGYTKKDINNQQQRNSTKRITYTFPDKVQREIRKLYKEDLRYIETTSKVWDPNFKFKLTSE